MSDRELTKRTAGQFKQNKYMAKAFPSLHRAVTEGAVFYDPDELMWFTDSGDFVGCWPFECEKVMAAFFETVDHKVVA